MSEKYKQKNWLRKKYHEENLSQREMSELCTCSRKTISRWMKKFDIETRDKSSSSMIAQSSCSNKHRDKDWLMKMYINKEKPLTNVAELCGCTSETIRSWLNKHNIDRRDSSKRINVDCRRKHTDKDWLEKTYKETGSIHKTSDICGCTGSTVIKWMKKFNIERNGNLSDCNKKHQDKNWLKEKFIEDKLSIKEIAEHCGCSNSVIHNFLEKFELSRDDITTDCNKYHKDKKWLESKYNTLNMSEMAEICGCSQSVISYWFNKYDITTKSGNFQSGESHINYKDGNHIKEELDFRKTDKWKSFSNKMKNDANWDCEYCSNSGKLHTHHIKPVSMGGDKWENEFIVLCKECHIGDFQKWHPPQLDNYIS